LSRLEERKNFLENGRQVWGGGREDGLFTPRMFVMGIVSQMKEIWVGRIIIAKQDLLGSIHIMVTVG
jgi:hypothetical protein